MSLLPRITRGQRTPSAGWPRRFRRRQEHVTCEGRGSAVVEPGIPHGMTILDDLRLFAEAGQRLREAGLLRSNNLVGDVGEWIASRYYGVPLAKTRTQGYDLITNDDKRVQVKTLRDGNDGRRSEAGRVLGPCDIVLLIRLAPDYTPVVALEIPFSVVEEVFGTKPVRWSLRFAADPRIRTVPGNQLSIEASDIPESSAPAD